MNQHRFASMLLAAAMVFFLISCGGGTSNEQKSTSDSTTTDTTATTTAPTTQTPTSTIVTTPQNMMVVTHKVKDFAKWKASYDANDSLKLANGIHNYVVGRGTPDTSMVLVATKVDDVNKAKAFGKSAALKNAMAKSGVMGAPTIHYTTMVWQDTGTVSTTLRVRSMFTVKDWDAWKKSFDSTMTLTAPDNGLKPRAYGHDADDNHKVTLVALVLDSTKAAAWFKSDELKKRRAAAGVVGEPQRMFYNVVQRY
jgi:hypothetical protein